ncbi:Mitochondrial import inner membrane translocase subunit tim22 [Paraconiothyrium brasiliense]|uniref:Mitochondrial import inner membrane translocase subunit TIM22 n=1 Tax=Paraconiothyrium brasiliense TaxID=300254 RepID=A0ABR3QPQ7_9PLEO
METNSAKPTPTPATAAAASSVSSTAASTASATATHPSLAGQMVSTPSGSVPLTDLPLRQQLKHGLRDMYRSSISSGKNFAKVGAIFSGTECAIEGLRAKNDLWNGVAGGCITGGVLARNAGPQAAAVGCVGFAAFSAAIDAYMVSERGEGEGRLDYVLRMRREGLEANKRIENARGRTEPADRVDGAKHANKEKHEEIID